MKAIITGNVMNFQEIDSEIWSKELQNLFRTVGKEQKDWTFYQENHFQLLIEANKAFEFAILIKATLIAIKPLDARIAIGIGEIEYDSEQITESNGSAFINSGEQFNELKKSTLAIRTTNERVNQELKTVVDLVTFIMNNWTEKMAEYFKIAYLNQNMNQKQLAKLLELKSQSTVSSILKRAAYDEIIQGIIFYQIKLHEL
jgi:hypothetical protein